jgi:hypothetical protein
MDMEELSQSQIVLLTLLVSFVTSMATGIVTVSLMSQAPVSVAETVNRVIQKTIHEVAPSVASAPSAPVVTTVVVHDADQIAGAVAKASSSIVRLYSHDGTQLLGLGVITKAGGTIATDVSALGALTDVAVVFADGSKSFASFAISSATTGVAYLSIATSTATSTPAWSPITFGTSPRLGQSVVLISGKSRTMIQSGLVNTLVPASDTAPALAETSISGDNVLYGSPIVDTTGALIGLSTSISRAVSPSAFIPAVSIK